MLMEQAIYKDFDTNAYNLYRLRQNVSDQMRCFLDFLTCLSGKLPKVKDNGDKSWTVEIETIKHKTLSYTVFQLDHDSEHLFEYIPGETRHDSYLAWQDFLNLIFHE